MVPPVFPVNQFDVPARSLMHRVSYFRDFPVNSTCFRGRRPPGRRRDRSLGPFPPASLGLGAVGVAASESTSVRSAATAQRANRPLSDFYPQLSRSERLHARFIAWVLKSPRLDRLLAACARLIGRGWVDLVTARLRQVHGLDRLPPLATLKKAIFVSNHRSFFDMFVLSMVLYREGFRGRLLYPVRANFFYDHPLGFVVNGLMSFWSMYPPIFRDRKRIPANRAAMQTLVEFVNERDGSVGIHPEGTRNKTDDPYTLLEPKRGVGQLIQQTEAPVIPAFIHGLGNQVLRQVWGNITGRGAPVIIVFGAPLPFEAERQATPGSRIDRAIVATVSDAITALGQEERALRRQISVASTTER